MHDILPLTIVQSTVSKILKRELSKEKEKKREKGNRASKG